MQLTANVNTQPRKIFQWPSFHVEQDKWKYFTPRFMEAWHRLDLKKGRRVKQLHMAAMLSEALGATMSPNTVKGWETGAIPDVESIAAVAALCGVHPAWLAFGLGQPDDPVVGDVGVRPPKTAPDEEEEVAVPMRARGKKLPSTKPSVNPRKRKLPPKEA